VKRPLFFGTLALAALLILPASVAAAATCQLTSTSTANGAGDDIHLLGTGYAPNADVEIQVLRNGAAVDPLTAHTDANGSFDVLFQTGPGRGGRYTFTTSTADCTASTEAVAVETAGGGTLSGGGSAGQSLPPTSTVPAAPASPASDVALLAVVAVVAAAGWGAAVAVRSRRA